MLKIEGFELKKNTQKTLKLQLDSFVSRHSSFQRPIALVTSGGTIAHLEQNSVRFIDNFSTGTRGAKSVEYLLEKGYACIHLWRRGSASPYARVIAEKLLEAGSNLDYNSMKNLFYDKADFEKLNSRNFDTDCYNEPPNQQSQFQSLSLHPSLATDPDVNQALRQRSRSEKLGLLVTVPFDSVEEYLLLLQLCCEAVEPYKKMSMIYLAAAVSDFWVPPTQRSIHKIDSSVPSSTEDSNKVILELERVPKIISHIRQSWAPHAYCISFKLETDPMILKEKMEKAVKKYSVHMVIGNILKTRYDQVTILHQNFQSKNNTAVSYETETIHKGSSYSPIEDQMIDFVAQEHFAYISSSSSAADGSIDFSYMNQRKRDISYELWYRRMKNVGLQVFGSLLGAWLSFQISSAIRYRIESMHSSPRSR